MDKKIEDSLKQATFHKVTELVLFGSVLHSPSFRDVDIGICIDKSATTDELQTKYSLHQQLEEIFQSTVDLILLDDHFQYPLLINSIRRKGITLISEGKIQNEGLPDLLQSLPNPKYLPSLDDLEEEMNILEDMIFQTLYKGFSCLESWTEFNIVDMDEKGMRKHGMFMISTALQIKENIIRAAERINKFMQVHNMV